MQLLKNRTNLRVCEAREDARLASAIIYGLTKQVDNHNFNQPIKGQIPSG